jgi:hypothetical protein
MSKTDEERLEILREELTEAGYFNLRVVEGRGICGLMQFIYTLGMCYGLNNVGYEGRYCYPYANSVSAVIALAVWDGKEDPKGDWIKHKGGVGDYSNPKNTNILKDV